MDSRGKTTAIISNFTCSQKTKQARVKAAHITMWSTCNFKEAENYGELNPKFEFNVGGRWDR